MSTSLYQGSMQNLDWETRVTDCEIRLLLGLPMADDSQDFLGMFAEEIQDRSDRIAELEDELKEEEMAYMTLDDECSKLKRELATMKAEINRLEKKNG